MIDPSFWEIAVAAFCGASLSLGLLGRATFWRVLLTLLTGQGFGLYLAHPVAEYVARSLQLDLDRYLLCAVAFVLGLLALSIVPLLRSRLGTGA